MKAILLTILMALSFTVRAEYIDLTGADILDKGLCQDGKKMLMCAVLLFQEKQYLATVDEKGEYKIFLIQDGVLNLIWYRDSI